MKFRVDREPLLEAVTWAARSLPSRPAVPILQGMLLALEGELLVVSAFDYEVSARTELEVTAQQDGRALVSGRLLADIVRQLPAAPVEVEADGGRATVRCGAARFTLPVLPVEDYPPLPALPDVVGQVEGPRLAAAVASVALAAGRDDTLPVLTGVRMELDGDRMTLVATDRYRLALRSLSWSCTDPALHSAALIPARTLAETARALSGASVTIALAHPGADQSMIGFEAAGRRATTRLLDGEFPKVHALIPTEFAAAATVATDQLADAVKRVALVAPRNSPIRLSFTGDQVLLEAGGADDAEAREEISAQFQGEDLSVAFNHAYLLDGLTALQSESTTFSFTVPSKPVLLTADRAPEGDEHGVLRYLLMPVRLGG